MWIASGFLQRHKGKPKRLLRLYDSLIPLIEDVLRCNGHVRIVSSMGSKQSGRIYCDNSKCSWIYEVYRVREGKENIVKKILYNAPVEDGLKEEWTVNKLLFGNEYKRAARFEEILK
jgi:hypothetical protein